MKHRRNVIWITFSVIIVFASTVFCSVFQPEEELSVLETDVLVQKTATVVPEKPTLEPTNLVKIEDVGGILPPKVISTEPAGGQEIGANGIIKILFDQSMDQEATSAALKVVDLSKKAINGSITWPQPDTLEFSPAEPFEVGSTYKVQLNAAAKSLSDVRIEDAVSFDVRIATNLMVSQVFPADAAVDVESNAVITVIFNRPVVPLGLVDDQADWEQPVRFQPEIEGVGKWLNTSVYIFQPEQALLSSTRYSVTVEAGLVDMLGTDLKEPFIWEFTTTAPRIASYAIEGPVGVETPKDNMSDVRLDSYFRIDFLQPMDVNSVAESFSLYSLNGENVPVRYDWKNDVQLLITPTLSLAMGTDYTLLLSQDARAATGGKLEEELRWNFRTLPYPEILSTFPQNNESQANFSSRFQIKFSSPMNLDTIEDKIEIFPEPEGDLTWYYDPWSWSADFYGLDPSTRYSVSVEPGIEDIYGNKITEPFTFQFKTGRLRPGAYLDMPYMPSIYRLNGPMKVYVSYVNVSTVDVDLYEIPVEYFVGFNNGTYSRWDFVPPEAWWVNSWRWDDSPPEDEIIRQSATLRSASGDSLDPGFYFLTIKSAQVPSQGPNLDTRLLVVTEANLTFKTTQTEALMWLTDLDTGAPLPDISLKVYEYNFEEIGSGATNANGLYYLNLPQPDEVYRFRYVISEDPLAFAISDWGSGASPYEFGVWSNYYALPRQPVAYVYTDRPLYRPGQTVNFKGILRQNDDLEYNLLPWEDVTVEINSYNESVYLENLNVTEFGTFDGEFTIDENAALGYYSIQVRSPQEDESIGGVSFSVAEFRKPEFQVTLNAEPEDVLVGDDFKVAISAEYYSGGMVANADVDWAFNSVDYYFQPLAAYRNYTFYDYDRDETYYGDYAPLSQQTIIASGSGTTDIEGQFELELKADLADAGRSQTLTFEATVSDIAGNAVSARDSVVAHKSLVYPGVRPTAYVGTAGEEQEFEIVLLDWNSDPVINSKFDVEVVERRWYSVQEQDPQGFVRWTSSVEEIPVASFSAVETDSNGKATIVFLPEVGGVYKAKVSTRDDQGNQSITGAYMWISDTDSVAWRQTDDRKMDLIADKDSYSPGETAEILIASPLSGDNYALITIERGHIRQYDVLRLTSNSVIYRLPITADMAPNVYYSVLVIQGADVGEKPDFRMGLIQLNVAKNEQMLDVEIKPDKSEVGPGDEVTYSIRTTDHDGKPAEAEVSLALVDLATLSLMESNSRPIQDYFYDQQSLSVMTAVPIVLSIEDYISTLEDRLTAGEGMGSGGGKGADVFGVMDIRGDFRDTALWRARVKTDQKGEAQVTVKLPDNLTVWRMDARAVTLDTLVGSGENDIRSSKPLLIRPQTPRFFVAGDQATLGAAVQNNTDAALNVRVSLEASGFSIKSQKVQNITVAAGGQQFLRWEGTVNDDVQRIDMVFSARSGKYSDATRPTMGTLEDQGIPVYRFETLDIVGTAGVLSEAGSRTEGLQYPSKWDLNQGELNIKISPSLAAGMVDGLDFLQHYPYECIEQTISRFLPNVLTTQVLASAGISDPVLEENLKDQVSIALQRLYNWQRSDGGWGWWPESLDSDPLTSSYVLLGLVEAKSAGYHVNQDTLNRAVNYLKGQLKSLGSLDRQFLLNRQAFMLYVLAKSNNPQISLSSVMYESRQSLSLYARAYLAETLWLIDSSDPRLATLISDFNNAAIQSATGVYWQEEWRDYWNWNTDTRTTAIILAALIEIDPENGLNTNAVRWLMAHRTKGHWLTTQETAWSLMALADWIAYTGELKPDFDWAVGVNNNRLGDGSATPETVRVTEELQLDIRELLPDDTNRITIARDGGMGTLYYTVHMDAFLPVDQIDPVDRGIMISREYFEPTNDDTPKSTDTARQGDLLLARLTIVVPNDLHYVIIADPLPAGLEAVDRSLETNPEINVPKGYDFSSIWSEGWGWWYFDHIELRDEKVLISADYLPAGTYVYTYLVRASTPGVYHVIPSEAHEFYFPEVYGRGAGDIFTVLP